MELADPVLKRSKFEDEVFERRLVHICKWPGDFGHFLCEWQVDVAKSILNLNLTIHRRTVNFLLSFFCQVCYELAKVWGRRLTWSCRWVIVEIRRKNVLSPPLGVCRWKSVVETNQHFDFSEIKLSHLTLLSNHVNRFKKILLRSFPEKNEKRFKTSWGWAVPSSAQ